MPNIAVGEIPVYTTDLGTAVNNLRFKMREDMLIAHSGFPVAANNVCSAGGGLFTPRAIKVDLTDGSSIRFPVANPANIATAMAAFRTIPGFACAHLEGERWRFIPPALVGAAGGNNTEYNIPDGPTTIITGSADYTSDLIGPTNVRFKMEAEPAAIYVAVFSCLENPVIGTAPCSPTAGIQPRKLTVDARNDNGGTISRLTKPQTFGGDVVDCAQTLYGVGLCVRYRGESARNAHLLV
ncbi:MAG: hypothetical protein ACFB0C_24260 [Leptolyngbyaceae cyanobacterium]